MSRSLLFSLTLLLLSLSSVQAERLPLRSFTIADGLANNGINKIVKDSRGFLWFCTANGLSRFDGYSFTNFGTEQGLPHAGVTDLLETRSGDYWIATYGGLVHFNPRGTPINQVYSVDEHPSALPMFSVVPSDDLDRRAKAVSVLFESHDGTVWCGTYKGLFQLVSIDGRLKLRSVEIGLPSGAVEQSDVRDMIEDQSQSLWIGTSSGLYRRWSDGSSARYTKQNGFPDHDISDLLRDSRGQLWAATLSGGFFEFAADSSHAPPSMIRSYRSTDGLTTDWVFQLFETSSGQIKIATNKGLAEFYPESAKQVRPLRLYTTSNGLTYREINALAEDSGGNLWLGTISGAMKLARDGFVSYGETDGLMWVGAILEDQNGGICFRGEVLGDQNATVFNGARLNAVGSDNSKSWPQFGRYFDERFSWFAPDAMGVYFGWVAEEVTLQARNGEWWIGSGDGLYRYAALDDFTKIKTARPLAHYTPTETKLTSTQIYRLFEDSRGDIWASTVGAPNGFSHWNRATDTWEAVNSPGFPSLADQGVNSIGEDRAGNIWVGLNTGVARLKQNSWHFFDAKDKFPPGNVQRIYSDSVGRLWLSSARSGLIRIDNPDAESPTLINYSTANGLSSNQLDVIVEDLQGDMYVGSDRGLDRLNPITGRVKHYSVADGLAPGTTYDALRARDGTLWFGTRQGLSRFTPTDDRVTAPPPILISSLEVAGKRQNISALGETNFRQADLSPGENQMHIEFVGVSFAPGEVLRYEYRLEGSDNDWSAPTNQRAVNYAGLAPGGYRFLVRAINSDGVISAAPATITFTVLPPVWRRWWFILLVAVSFSVLGFFLYRYRVARIYELANIRTRIATDLHDDVGSGLSQVSILSEVISRRVGHTDGVGEQLATIGSLSRDLVDSMSDIVWAINPGRDRLSDLSHRMRRFASDVFSAKGIEFSFEDLHGGRDLGLGPEMRRELYLIFKEAVNNVARHSGCTFVKIRFATNRGNMELAVHDNGNGFDQSSDQEGNGLVNMKLRAKKLGGELWIGSNNGDGTAVKLTVPLTHSRWWLWSRH